jgi:hypothetical protein
LAVVIMDMHAAGRMAIYRGRGVINKHGTLRTATANAVFFVFDMLASDWADVLSKLVKWLGLINGFGQAAYTTAKWASALPQTKWAPEVTGHLKVLNQFHYMATGKTIKTALDFAARLSDSSSQSSSSDGSASKKHKTTGTTPFDATDFTTNKVDVDKALLEVETKEAQAFTCRVCTSPYTDGSGSGSGSKKNYGFCSSTCRTAKKSAPQEPQERKASASTGVRRSSARPAARRASASTGARRPSAGSAARSPKSFCQQHEYPKAGARTAARAPASTGAARARARTAAMIKQKADYFATRDKTDVPYGADEQKAQQEFKLAKVAKTAAKKAAKVAKTAAKKAMAVSKKAEAAVLKAALAAKKAMAVAGALAHG